MYMTTREGFEQAPMPAGFFAGTLGKNVLPPLVQEFLKQVRKRPQDHKRLLLTVTFHPLPALSNIDITVPGSPGLQRISDLVLFSGITDGDLLDELRLIRDAFRKTNGGFRRQIEAELRLRNTLFKTTGRLVRNELLRTDGKVSKKLEPFLLAASAPGFGIPFTQAQLGLNFAQQMLPKRLADRIRQSEASEAHLTSLGKLLGRYAELLQERDSGFKQLVEQERKKTAPVRKKKP